MAEAASFGVRDAAGSVRLGSQPEIENANAGSIRHGVDWPSLRGIMNAVIPSAHQESCVTTSRGSRLRNLTSRDVRAVAVTLTIVLCMSMLFLISMTFQPGWANGWPMGISKHTVFSSFVMIIFVVASLSGATLILILPCYLAEHVLKKPFLGWTSLIVAIMLVAVGVLAACPQVYAAVHADIVREWR